MVKALWDPVDLDGSNKFQKLLKYQYYIPQTLNSASTNLLYKNLLMEIPFAHSAFFYGH